MTDTQLPHTVEQVTEADEAAVADVQWHLAAQLDETDRLTLERSFAKHRLTTAALLDRIEKLETSTREALLLIDEINERSSSRKFWGISQSLHAKIATIRATLTRTLLTKDSTTKETDDAA